MLIYVQQKSAVMECMVIVIADDVMIANEHVIIIDIMATQDLILQVTGWALVIVMDFIFALNLFRKKN
jgi:hypothetical protein